MVIGTEESKNNLPENTQTLPQNPAMLNEADPPPRAHYFDPRFHPDEEMLRESSIDSRSVTRKCFDAVTIPIVLTIRRIVPFIPKKQSQRIPPRVDDNVQSAGTYQNVIIVALICIPAMIIALFLLLKQ